MSALVTFDLVDLFFPKKKSEVPNESSLARKRPPVDENLGSTMMYKVDRERAQLDALIKTVDHIFRNSLSVENLATLCDEVVEGCKKYGGVKKYLGDNNLSNFILEHASNVGYGPENIDVRKPTPRHPVIPPDSSGQTSVSIQENKPVPNYGATWLQRVGGAVRDFFKKK